MKIDENTKGSHSDSCKVKIVHGHVTDHVPYVM